MNSIFKNAPRAERKNEATTIYYFVFVSIAYFALRLCVGSFG